MTSRPILFSPAMVRGLLREIENRGSGKTQTRRLAKWKPVAGIPSEELESLELQGWDISDGTDNCLGDNLFKVPFHSGDRLWVRESWRPSLPGGNCDPWHVRVAYPADGQTVDFGWADDIPGDWNMPKAAEKGNVPSIHMPRWASRITLEVTDVRVERLKEISEQDAVAEGIEEVSALWPADDEGFEGAPYPSYADYGPDANGCFSGYGAAGLSFMKLWDSLNAQRAPWDSNPWVTVTTFVPHLANIDQWGNVA